MLYSEGDGYLNGGREMIFWNLKVDLRIEMFSRIELDILRTENNNCWKFFCSILIMEKVDYYFL